MKEKTYLSVKILGRKYVFYGWTATLMLIIPILGIASFLVSVI